MDITTLLEAWQMPDRTQDRTQITLRISVQDYARLHALKAVYPTRSVNDFLCDIVKAGLDDIVKALPSYIVDEDDIARGLHDSDDIGLHTGPKAVYQNQLMAILSEKSEEVAA